MTATQAGPPPEGRDAGQPATAKGEQTRQRIVDAATRLLEERGYASTTMRAVAEEAGVSLGNAYYYFSSKEHLVQGFYDRLQTLHGQAAVERMSAATSLGQRFTASELAFLDVAARYQPFAGKLFSVAADPASPLSPLSQASTPARQASTAIMRTVVQGSVIKADERLLRELPDLLWLAHMGVVLFWVHDRSPGQRRTRRLVTRSAPVLERLVTLSRWRALRPTVHELLDLVTDLRTGGENADGG